MLPTPSDSVLLVVDVQERLLPAMPDAERPQALKALENLVWLYAAMGLPVVFTEQYPQGLGPTHPPLRALAPEAPLFAKMTFSALGEPGVGAALDRPHVVLCGVETHICVATTGLALREAGKDVTVVSDACLSRREADRAHGLALLRHAGARVAPHETICFGLVERAGTPLFKELSRRVR
jgi:nicotinamidase-related amidase